MTDRQRNTIIKTKKNYGFNYLPSHKTIRKSDEKIKYIRTLKYLIYTHKLHLNPFSFKVHEKSTVEY
jgi:hypothetical protein